MVFKRSNLHIRKASCLIHCCALDDEKPINQPYLLWLYLYCFLFLVGISRVLVNICAQTLKNGDVTSTSENNHNQENSCFTLSSAVSYWFSLVLKKGPCSISLGENKEKSKDFNISNIYLVIFLVYLLDPTQIPRSLLFSFVVSKTWKICYTHTHIHTRETYFNFLWERNRIWRQVKWL